MKVIKAACAIKLFIWLLSFVSDMLIEDYDSSIHLVISI